MQKIRPATRYLITSVLPFVMVGMLSILGNLAVTDTITLFARRRGELDRPFSNHTEATAAIFILLISLIFFSIQFKVVLSNGVSRKTFFWANLASFVVISAGFALFITLVTLAHLPFGQMTLISQSLYTGANLMDATFLQIALYFLVAVSGWLIHLAYYRSGTLLRWIISLAPFGLLWAVISSGRSSGILWETLVALAGFANHDAPQVYTAVLSLVGAAALLSGVIYLLLRRAPLKE